MTSLLRTLFMTLILIVGTTSMLKAEEFTIATGEWPPFISKTLPDQGLYTKIMTMILEEAGFDVTYDFMPWKRAYLLTQNGRYAATFIWYHTDEREVEVLYPKYPVVISYNVVFIKVQISRWARNFKFG